MASNRELREGIESLSIELGLSLPDGLQGMNNPRLVETLEALQVRKAGGSLPPADGAGQEPLPLGNAGAPAGDPPPPDSTSTPPDASEPPPVPPAAPPPPAAKTAPKVQEAEAPKRCHVAEGKSVTTLKGQLGAFQSIRAIDLPGGAEQLEQLVKDGFVTRSDRLRS